MKTGVKTLIWVLVAVIIIFGIYKGYKYYKYLKGAADRVNFGKPTFQGVDLKSILDGGTTVTVDLTVTATNGNNFGIPVSGLYAEVYYNGVTVAKSNATTATTNTIIPVFFMVCFFIYSVDGFTLAFPVSTQS